MHIDCKLHVDTKFTPAQDEILKNLNRDILVMKCNSIPTVEGSTMTIGTVLKLSTDDLSNLILK